jgi:hypothetical protein
VEIKTGGNPTLRRNRRNRINRNNYEAVWVHEGGRGVIEDNDLTGNKGRSLGYRRGLRAEREAQRQP